VSLPVEADVLGWRPTVTFAGLMQMMVDADLQRLAPAARAVAAEAGPPAAVGHG
jgi:hypothetical protein